MIREPAAFMTWADFEEVLREEKEKALHKKLDDTWRDLT